MTAEDPCCPEVTPPWNYPPWLWERATREVNARYGYNADPGSSGQAITRHNQYHAEARSIFTREVEDYVQAGLGHRWSMTMQTRRVVKALLLIGIPRRGFRARTARESDGTYGTALGNIYEREDMAKVIRYAELLVVAGLRVHVLNSEPGRESAFVSTPDVGQTPEIVVFAAVSGRDALDPAYAVQNVHEELRPLT